MCYNPIKIYDKSTDTYKIASCRHCLECMQTRANEWALRGHFELLEHKENCFITLTYEKNPVRLHKEDMQNFIKRLRKSIEPIKIKYFSVGEYGDKNFRPHYHIIIFGYDFNDRQFLRMSQSDIPIYDSKELNKLWPEGIAIIQEANANTVRYSARYSAKLKIDLPEHLKNYPEYNTMSQSLGVEAIMRNIETYLKTDEIYMDGFAYKIPNIILEKYAKTLTDPIEREFFQQDYQTERNFRYNTKEQLKIRERLAQKKLLHAKIREL